MSSGPVESLLRHGSLPLLLVSTWLESRDSKRVALILIPGAPVMENVPLAHALFSQSDVGGYIPSELITPVAEVFRWVQQMRDEQDPDAASDGPSLCMGAAVWVA